MVYFTYKKLNICTVFLLASVFAVLIAAVAVGWYQYDVQYTYTLTTQTATSFGSQLYNQTLTTFDMFGQTKSVKSFGSQTTVNTFNTYADLGVSGVKQQFYIELAFVLIALLTTGLLFVAHFLYFFDGFRNKVLFLVGVTTLRTLLVIALIIVIAAETVAFLAFLGISAKFNQDNSSCSVGPCKKFADSITTDLGSTTVNSNAATMNQVTSWGPTAGWYLVLATIPLSIFALVVVVLNRFPIPVDSLGTGEAL